MSGIDDKLVTASALKYVHDKLENEIQNAVFSSNVTVSPLSVTRNGTYDAPVGTAFSSVTVNVVDGIDATNIKQINFIDYDGAILHSYTTSEWESETELPPNPLHTGLVAQGWNWSKSQIDSMLSTHPNISIYVGQMYTTASGATEIDITLEDGYLSPYLQIAPNGTIIIDWGDNTPTDTVTGSTGYTNNWILHEYDTNGDYTIRLTVTSGNFYFSLSSGPYSGVGVLSTEAKAVTDRRYSNCISAIRLGSGAGIVTGAFQNLYNLKSITIPNGVTSIGNSAFGNCYSLQSITIPNSVTSIGNYAFENCYLLQDLTITSSVTSIGEYAFFNCYTLTSVIMPIGVMRIGSNAFFNCYALTSVIIPISIVSIGNFAFENCYLLQNITIPYGVTTISSCTFRQCYSLKSITIPNSVTSIGNNAFENCYSLQSITIPSSVTSIGHDAFSACYSLANITIPSAVTSIASGTFYQCYSLESITIPSGVTSIGMSAFYACGNTKEYHFLSTTPPILSSNVFTGINNACKFYVPAESIEEYRTDANWSFYAVYLAEDYI